MVGSSKPAARRCDIAISFYLFAALCWLLLAVASVVQKCLPLQCPLHTDRFRRRARNHSGARGIGISSLVQCPVKAYLRDSSTGRALKNHDKSASDAGGANHRYWDSCDRRSPPRRQRNAEVRAREYLTDGEIARLIDAGGRIATATAMPPWCWSPTGTGCGRASW